MAQADGGPLKRTPLAAVHEAMGARMIPFAGWWMPVQYRGIVDEHLAVRRTAGLFDLSHMGELELRGPQAARELDRLVTCDIEGLEVGQARYGVMCLPAGGIIDDLVIYRLGPERFMVVVNAACHAKDLAWMQQHLAGADLTLVDRSDEMALVALQGPHAQAILQPLCGGSGPDGKAFLDLEHLGYYRCVETTVAGVPALVARTGYTGEDGFELFVDGGQAQTLWQVLLERVQSAGGLPVGLGARDTLRMEARYPLYGNDIDETTTPIEANLGWVVDLDKPQFIGRHALLEQKQRGVLRRLVGFVVQERAIARPHYDLLDEQGRRVGTVTSGGFAPSLQQSVGMGYVPQAMAAPGTPLWVDVRGRRVSARIVKGSFVQLRTRSARRSQGAARPAQGQGT